MKTVFYLSGIIGGVLVFYWFSGIYHTPPHSILFLLSGLAMICLVCLPLYFYDSRQQRKKIDEIIRSHKGEKEPVDLKEHQKSPARGWSMNNSPFRNRKSGLTWGGGNIHAGNASRGTRRNFGKK